MMKRFWMVATMVAAVVCLFGCSQKNADSPLSDRSVPTESLPSLTDSATGTFDEASTDKAGTTTAATGNVNTDSTTSGTAETDGKTTTGTAEDTSASDATATTTNGIGTTTAATTSITTATTRAYENDSGWMEWIPV